MSDDQYFGTGGKPENKMVTAMRELAAAVKDPATLHHHHYPTIGQTWTDPATGLAGHQHRAEGRDNNTLFFQKW